MLCGAVVAPIFGAMKLGLLTTAGVDMTMNVTSQYAANNKNAGDINMVEAGMSGVPYIGKIPYLSKLAPTLIGETFSFTANTYKDGITGPDSLKKWGAQVGGGVISFGFGKATDNHLAGEKGGEVVGGFFKWLVETGSNVAPNEVK